ncbi:hypothetical protein ABT040_40460 [Streptomyces sp. NPDC002688]|uniref:vWA-MoxR associated conflict system protein n=1 Tax=Streptomyces sp. NPDC002688 TaxID=3154423 RepID=UPI0033308445
MTVKEPPRHALVIAAQCDSMEHLEDLDSAAKGLHEVLLDPRRGGCRPGLSYGSSLVVGRHLSSDDITDLVRDGYRYAGRCGAVFVLALLGHGFTPGSASTLYYMGKESVEGVRDGAVNVNDLLITAADHQAVRGVIGLLDMCHAGGAMPTAHELAAGARGGKGRISLLMASSVHQTARALRFSKNLTRVLVQGVDDCGPVVDVVRAGLALRPVLGQDIVIDLRDGDQSANVPLWLGWNARHQGRGGSSLIGFRAREQVAAALAALATASGQDPWPVPADLPQALILRDKLQPTAASGAEHRAVTAVNALITAATTTKFIRSFLGADLTTDRLRRALNLLLSAEPHVPSAAPDLTDQDILDHLSFEHPAGEDCRRWVTRFVLLLAQEAERDLDEPILLAWAESIDAQILVNDARAFARQCRAERRLSLVVSLHSSLAGDWPDALDCWLLQDGSLLQRTAIRCETPGRAGAEEALDDAVIWAEDEADALGFPLRRVDIALPTSLLLDWRPEEAGIDELLGLRHQVVLHWSGRLTPTRLLKRLQGAVRDRWEAVVNSLQGAPVDWVGTDESLRPDRLRAALRLGHYPRAIGLNHHPGAAREPLMEMLLGYTPVLIWPDQDTDRAEQWCQDLNRHWPSLPDGILHAYRRVWKGGHPEAIADLRLVWDNGEWLDFCRRLSHSEPLDGRPKEAP